MLTIHDAGYVCQGQEVTRISLGELIPSSERKTFPPEPGAEKDTYTGSTGFMDLIEVPSFSFPRRNPVPALIVLVIGIEPESRRHGHASQLLRWAEERAKEQGLGAVIADSVDNEHMAKHCRDNGYEQFYSTFMKYF